MKKPLLRALVLIACMSPGTVNLHAQVSLKPFIGLYSLPNDGDSVCAVPLAIDPGNNFLEPGLQEGDTIPDFTLYTPGSDSIHMSELLLDGKPVLLVGGSYTCPVFRNHLNQLEDLQSQYGNDVHIYIIYTVEAHPADPDISPYKGEVWQLTSNDNLGIIYHEAETYGDRKNTLGDMMAAIEVPVPVLIDGPCNNWWQAFALAPNPAFLIRPDGVIYKKQGWFDNSLFALSNAIDSLLQSVPTGLPSADHGFVIVNDPSLPYLQFHFPGPPVSTGIYVFDLMGRVLHATPAFCDNRFTLQKQGLSGGTYLYSILRNGAAWNGKIMVQ